MISAHLLWGKLDVWEPVWGKTPWPGQCIRGRIYLGLWFYRDESPAWQGGMVACSRHGGRRQAQRPEQEAERSRLQWQTQSKKYTEVE